MDNIQNFIPQRFVENENAFIVTNAEGQILWVNPALTILCGYEVQELEGKKPGTLLQGLKTEREAVEQMRHALKAGIACVVELTNYHKDGHTYPVHIQITPIANKDGVIRFFAAIERSFTEKEVQEIGRETLQGALHAVLQDFVEHLKRNL